MAFLVRWWQSFLRALSSANSDRDDGWVEPGNTITRAILSGAVSGLPALQLEASAQAEVLLPALPAAADVPDVEVEPAAAEETREAPSARPRKRRAHRAA